MGVVCFFFSLSLSIQQFSSMLSPDSTTVDTSSTTTSVDSMSRLFMFLFLSTCGILGTHSRSGELCFHGFIIFTVLHVDIFFFFWVHAVLRWSCLQNE